ncbi:DNA polymerase IV [Pedobacter sp.]|uniref:DNA polymerase IV n=1 Tax=Pedobacter sp. TaxID=1411316 RepID=UPI003D7F2EE8
MNDEDEKRYRKIIHIDMDAFYASVEQRDFPEYKGKAIAVGGSPEGRGVIATASYEARQYGIHSAMSSKKAIQLCPFLIFVRPRFDAYKEASIHIREIFSRFTDLIQPLSLDEAYLDVTQDKLGIGSALEIAAKIKQLIKEELQLTASAGVSINKFVAKIASDINKPDGLTFIGPSKIESFMEKLHVEKFHGVGKVTAEKMKLRGLHTGADLKKLTEAELVHLFGKSGHFYYKIVRGLDDRKVESNRETKSVGAEDTFSHDLVYEEEMHLELEKIARIVETRINKNQLKARTITLKIKFSDFRTITRSKSFPRAIASYDFIFQAAKNLLATVDMQGQSVRLLGITTSNFGEDTLGNQHEGYQGRLFS